MATKFDDLSSEKKGKTTEQPADLDVEKMLKEVAEAKLIHNN